VFSESLIEPKTFKSGFKNRHRITAVCGSEFQTDGAEIRKARLETSVQMNG